MTVLLEYLDSAYSTCSWHLFYNFNPILLSLVGILSYAYSSFTAIFNSFLFAACVILAETTDFHFYYIKPIVQLLPRLVLASYLSCLLLDSFLSPKGTPLMFNLANYWF